MTVITLGTFDMLHAGHLLLLHKCRQLGDKTVVGLNTDAFITQYKGSPPVLSYGERRQALEATGLVDGVIPNSQADGSAKQLIELSRANLIVIGSDWARKDYLGQLGLDWDWLDALQIGICYVTYTPGISTTKLKERLASHRHSDHPRLSQPVKPTGLTEGV